MNYSDFQNNETTQKIDIMSIGLKDAAEPITVQVGNANIMVYPKLPKEDFINAVDWITTRIIGANNYISPVIKDGMIDLAILKFYTNFDIDSIVTDVENKYNLYEILDIIDAAQGFAKVKDKIDMKQYNQLLTTVDRTCDAIVNYRTSALGIFESLSQSIEFQTQLFEKASAALKDENVKDFISTVTSINNASNGEILNPKK